VRVLKSYTYMPGCDQQIPELELGYPDSLVVEPQPVIDSTATGFVDGPTGAATGSRAIRWSYYPNPSTGLLDPHADVDMAFNFQRYQGFAHRRAAHLQHRGQVALGWQPRSRLVLAALDQARNLFCDAPVQALGFDCLDRHVRK
jgi:hypothetical protein